MAITAAITLADDSLQSGQRAQATLTVSNSGGSDVVVTDIQPTVSPKTAACALGTCPFGGPVPSTVPASGSVTFQFPLVGFSPQVAQPPQTPAEFVLTVGATVYTNDGAITEASTAALTISPSVSV